jgi:hypothetical protein
MKNSELDWTRAKTAGDRTRPAHKFTGANDSKALAALLRNFFTATRSDAPMDEEGRPTAPLRSGASTRPKNGQNETLISPGETKRFAGRVASHWNHY